MTPNTNPLIAIVGPTASGKTALGLEIAQACNGEIICADSRTVYKDLDIGTAKPTPAEQDLIPHHLLDVVDPSQSFSVADFQRLAKEAITGIRDRGKLPIVVGGTGLYIDALLYDYSLRAPSDPKFHAEMETLSDDELRAKVDELGIELGESDRANRRRLIRASETGGVVAQKSPQLPTTTLIIGLKVERAVLAQRIQARTQAMLAAGFLDEVSAAYKTYGADAPGLSGIGYREFVPVVLGKNNVEEATAAFIRGDVQLAKRQMTWFKRNRDIRWVESSQAALELAQNFLAVHPRAV